jgi:hypothetical protein
MIRINKFHIPILFVILIYLSVTITSLQQLQYYGQQKAYASSILEDLSNSFFRHDSGSNNNIPNHNQNTLDVETNISSRLANFASNLPNSTNQSAQSIETMCLKPTSDEFVKQQCSSIMTAKILGISK